MGRQAPPEVADFLREAKSILPIERAILFGSRARGDYLEDSDYDLIVVSHAFQGIPFYERAVPLLRIWRHPQDLEVLCYTPEEFDMKRRGLNIVSTAVAEGTEVTA